MKLSPTKKLLVLVLVAANAWLAAAQSNDVSATDYASFSRLIADRNIFDPNRYAHSTRTAAHSTYKPRTHSTAAPAFSLVGTMSYEKGLFAFFSGNSAEYKKILVLNDSVAGYTMTEISATQVTLQTPDKKTLVMRIGDLMRQESGHWELTGPGEVPTEPAVVASEAAQAGSEEGAAPAAEPVGNPAAATSGAASEILKRLMQKREQESK